MRLSSHSRFQGDEFKDFKKFYKSNQKTFLSKHAEPHSKSGPQHLETADGSVVYLVREEINDPTTHTKYSRDVIKVATPAEFSGDAREALLASSRQLFKMLHPEHTDVDSRSAQKRSPSSAHSVRTPSTSGYSSDSSNHTSEQRHSITTQTSTVDSDSSHLSSVARPTHPLLSTHADSHLSSSGESSTEESSRKDNVDDNQPTGSHNKRQMLAAQKSQPNSTSTVSTSGFSTTMSSSDLSDSQQETEGQTNYTETLASEPLQQYTRHSSLSMTPLQTAGSSDEDEMITEPASIRRKRFSKTRPRNNKSPLLRSRSTTTDDESSWTQQQSREVPSLSIASYSNSSLDSSPSDNVYHPNAGVDSDPESPDPRMLVTGDLNTPEEKVPVSRPINPHPEKTPERARKRVENTNATIHIPEPPTDAKPEVIKAYERVSEQLKQECNTFLEEQACQTPEEEQAVRILLYGALINAGEGLSCPRDDSSNPVFDQLNVNTDQLFKDPANPEQASRKIHTLMQSARHRIRQHKLYTHSTLPTDQEVQRQRLNEELTAIANFCKINDITSEQMALWSKQTDDTELITTYETLRFEDLVFGQNTLLESKSDSPETDYEHSEKLRQDITTTQWLSQTLQNKTAKKVSVRERYRPRHTDLSYIPPKQRPGRNIFSAMLDAHRTDIYQPAQGTQTSSQSFLTEADINQLQQQYMAQFAPNEQPVTEVPKAAMFTVSWSDNPSQTKGMSHSEFENFVSMENAAKRIKVELIQLQRAQQHSRKQIRSKVEALQQRLERLPRQDSEGYTTDSSMLSISPYSSSDSDNDDDD